MIAAEFKDDVDTAALVNFVENVRVEYEDDTVKLSVVGRPILLGEVKKELPKMISIFAISVLVISIFLYLFFRTWVGVVVPMVVAFSVTVLGFGVIGFTGYNMDPLLLLLPFFVFATVLSHSVQFVSRVFDELDEGNEMKEAVRIGLKRLLFPSTAAIITDAAGFTVLALVAIPSIQSLAVICTIWLLTLTPGIIVAAAFMSFLKKPKKYKTILPFHPFLATFFGEKESRVLICVDPKNLHHVLDYISGLNIRYEELGSFNNDLEEKKLLFGPIDLTISDLIIAHQSTF